MKIITLLNEKGGVGKTTLATHLAAGLAIRGKKVVLADTDMQANATAAFGLPEEPAIYDLLVRGKPLRDVIRVIPPERYIVPDEVGTVTGGLYVIPSNYEARSIPNNISDAQTVLEAFKPLRGHIDVVIIDTSPTANLLHSAIYIATDSMMYPTRLEEWSFSGLNKVMQRRTQADAVRQQAGLPPIHVLGIVPMMCRMNTALHQDNYAKLTEAFGDIVLQPIPQRTIWAEASQAYRPVFAFAPDSRAAEDAWRVVDHVMEHAYV